MKLRFTLPAQNDLDQIFDYVSRDSRVTAARIVERIVERAKSLANYPYTGRPADEEGIRVASLPRLRYVMKFAFFISGICRSGRGGSEQRSDS